MPSLTTLTAQITPSPRDVAPLPGAARIETMSRLMNALSRLACAGVSLQELVSVLPHEAYGIDLVDLAGAVDTELRAARAALEATVVVVASGASEHPLVNLRGGR